MTQRIASGTWIVLTVVVLGLLGVWGSWLRYHEENPTSVQAELIRSDSGDWSVIATFSEESAERIVPGTLAVFTSPLVAGKKMAALVEERLADGRFRLRVTVGPPEAVMEKVSRAECVVTIDAATAPR